jgi:hypothetical protein
MVIGAKFPTDKIVSARFEAIKYGIEADFADQTTLIFYGDMDKASRVCARWDGRIIAAKRIVRRFPAPRI